MRIEIIGWVVWTLLVRTNYVVKLSAKCALPPFCKSMNGKNLLKLGKKIRQNKKKNPQNKINLEWRYA